VHEDSWGQYVHEDSWGSKCTWGQVGVKMYMGTGGGRILIEGRWGSDCV